MLAMLLLALPSQATASFFARCEGVVDRLGLRHASLTPDEPAAGRPLCARLEASPNVTLGAGSTLRVSHPAFGRVELSLCDAAGISCPIQAHAPLRATVCVPPLPLATIVLAGERLVGVAVNVSDERGLDVGCYHVAAVDMSGDAHLDDEIEENVVGPLHHSLRRALLSHTHGGGVSAQEAAQEAVVASRLREAYEASPDWADAFARWRTVHRKEYVADVVGGGAGLGAGVLAEAAAFAAFRENVLSRVRTGKPLSLDERFDLTSSTRRTLSHFA